MTSSSTAHPSAAPPARDDRARVNRLRDTIEDNLTTALPAADSTALAPKLIDAMRYSTLAGGKRLRPLLCAATAVAAGGTAEQAIPAGLALEYMHTYSLIHDDLPAMDDDSLRRGKPTCHIVYGEADAILAGDALQALAFETLTNQSCAAATRIKMLKVLSYASGWVGMVGGQSLDLELTGTASVTQAQLERLHAAKTGALLQASTELGALAAEPAEATTVSLCRDIGAKLGLAFQVIDDVLDISQSTETLGKDAGSDAEQGKTTFVDLLGMAGAQDYAHALHETAHQLMRNLPGDTSLLAAVAWDLVFRDH